MFFRKCSIRFDIQLPVLFNQLHYFVVATVVADAGTGNGAGISMQQETERPGVASSFLPVATIH